MASFSGEMVKNNIGSYKVTVSCSVENSRWDKLKKITQKNCEKQQ